MGELDSAGTLDQLYYTRAEQVLVRLGELLRYPPRHRMPALLLFGATGMGKTRIIERFLRENDSHFDEVRGTTRLPVVALQMPPTPHERDFYEESRLRIGTHKHSVYVSYTLNLRM